MADYPYVNYRQYFNGDDPEDYDAVCFSDLNSQAIKIDFFSEIDSLLKPYHVKFWTKFLEQILNNEHFTHKLSDNKEKLTWHLLNCKKLGYARNLLYLTAFRYIQEFPTIVLELYKDKNLPINELFDKFIDIHLLVCKDGLNLKYDDSFYGHSLLSPYNADGYERIDLKKFKSNLKSRMGTVNEYFNQTD